ncbi:MAG: cyanophycinase [Limnohabitans sp.]
MVALLLGAVCATASAGKSYTYTALGNPGASASAKPIAEQSIMLMGGGYDVGEAFRWMINRAGITPTTGGHFLVIRATGTDAYNPYIYSDARTVDTTTPKLYDMVGGKTMGLLSAATLIIPTRTAANDPQVVNYINSASAIFIAGGNQADYYNDWRGTGVETALRAALSKNIPIGGTSAGAEMLGQFDFAALNGAVTSSQALADPFNKYMTIDPLNTAYTSSFLSPGKLARTITDVHVNTRDRLGRSMAFMARLGMSCSGPLSDVSSYAIALDEETALLIAGSTSVSLAVNPYNSDNFTSGLYYKTNSVYYISANTSPTTCKAGTPLTYPSGAVVVKRLSAAGALTTPPISNGSYTASFTTTQTNYGVNKGVITFNGNTFAPY